MDRLEVPSPELLIHQLAIILDCDASQLSLETKFEDLGLDSLALVELAAWLDDFGLPLEEVQTDIGLTLGELYANLVAHNPQVTRRQLPL